VKGVENEMMAISKSTLTPAVRSAFQNFPRSAIGTSSPKATVPECQVK
jgi:hypothetical protein